MSVYFSLVLGSICRANHHRLAVMALQHLTVAESRRWCDLFLHHHAAYLEGAKAPDEVFKDFKNHVLHVGENDWGGAPMAAREWYRRTVRALKSRDWKHAAYCAGVMSHYVVDPVQPFHTAQSEAENTIHRAVEWSVSKAFPELHLILRQDLGFPEIAAPEGENWLEDMVRQGAVVANRHYATVIDHYDFEIGVRRPVDGLDQELKDTIAALMGYATILLARVLDRAFFEAGVSAPRVNLTLDALFAVMKAPLRAILGSIDNDRERAMVAAQFEEFRRTGKVRETLSEDDRVVRALHAEEVLEQPLSSLDCLWPQESGTAHGEGAPARLTRKLSRRKLAERLAGIAEPAIGGELPPPRDQGVQPRLSTDDEEDDDDDFEDDDLEFDDPGELDDDEDDDDDAVEVDDDDEDDDEDVEADMAARPATRSGDPALGSRSRIRLARQDAVADAPSIGIKTANRLHGIGVKTVGDLLALSPDDAARRIKASHINPRTIRNWQSQALLACTIPDLSGSQAQLLVGAGVFSISDLAEADAAFLVDAIADYAQSSEGRHIARGMKLPGADQITGWIDAAAGNAASRNAA